MENTAHSLGGGRGAAPSWRGLTAGAGPREPGGQSGKKGAGKESSSRRSTGWEINRVDTVVLHVCASKKVNLNYVCSVCEVKVTKSNSL